MNLESLGWNPAFAAAFQPLAVAGLVPARVSVQHKNQYEILGAAGEFAATCTGRLLRNASDGTLPAVGDWVAVRIRPDELQSDIHAVLPRQTVFSRRAAGETGEKQVIAANIDTVLVVTGLDHDFNLRRLERYLTASRQSGAEPVVVLNKADLHPDPVSAQAAATAIAGAAPVILVSALVPSSAPSNAGTDSPAGEKLDWQKSVEEALQPWLRPGRTLAFLGSSGAGKSTLINRLLGDEHQRTAALSTALSRGRHTTTRRELLVTPSGALVIDTPGLRELQLWEVGEEAFDVSFADIAALAAQCRFHDCAHRGEPGCAVAAALEAGSLDPGRWESYQKLQREQAYAARRSDPRLARENRAVWRKIHFQHRQHTRWKENNG